MEDSDDEEETMQVDKPSSVASALETIWTAEMLLLTHLNFGEIIGRVSPVHLKSLSRRFLHREARQALSEFLAWLVIF